MKRLHAKSFGHQLEGKSSEDGNNEGFSKTFQREMINLCFRKITWKRRE